MVLMKYAGISQTSKDSITCLPNSQLRKVIRSNEEGKIAIAELALMKENNNALLLRISYKDDIIQQYINQDSIQMQIITNFEIQVKALEEKIAINEKWVKDLRKQLRRQKTKTFLVGTLGVLTTAATFYFLTK